MPQSSSTKRLLKIIGFSLVLIIILGLAAKAAGWLDGSENTVEVETAKAEIRTITQMVSASGRIQPEVEVIIRPDVSGEVIELNVIEGDFVRKGDLLLRIKPDIYQARIDELNAALLTQKSRMEQARAQMLQAEVEFKKNETLYQSGNISELEFLQAKNNFEAQKANLNATEFQIQSAEAQLRRAEELEQTVIRAPQDGTISSLSIERGERVLGNAQTAGTEMLRIARMNQMEVEVDVNENDIVNVSANDTTNIEVDAYPNRSFEGVVTEIANSALITGSGSAEQVTNYKVKVRISTPHNIEMAGSSFAQDSASEITDEMLYPNFKPGMSATVDIKTKTAENVVTVPIQAVTVRDISELSDKNDESEDSEDQESIQEEDLRRVVFKVIDGIAKVQEVETGISDNTHIQIMSGIENGEEIVTGSYRILSRELADGDAVEILNNSDLIAKN
jgi:HlyD family secretion protein